MRFNTIVATLAVALVATSSSFAAPLFSEDFEIDPTANWTVNKSPVGVDEAHDFFFDYSTVGIPQAPNSKPGDDTRGMKLQVNLSSGIFGGMSASPIGQSFTGDYTLKFDWWGNFNGPMPAGGSGSTNLSTYGINTAGTSAQWPGGVQDSIWFGATADGGSSVDYRAYSPAAGTGYTPASGVFAAGTGSSPDARNDIHPYYQDIGGVAAPPAQVALFPQQGQPSGAGPAVTAAGAAGMQWHEVTIDKTGDVVTWYLGSKLIATVDTTGIDFGGSNIFFGHSDINATSSADPNDVHLLFTLIDNVRVVPEASSLALGLIGVLGSLATRRRR